MSKDEQGYNGWANYETWSVKLWLDNDNASYNYWQERTREVWENAQGLLPGQGDTSVNARIALADELKDFHQGELPELQGFAADLLQAALDSVDFYEIADSLLQDAELEGYEERE